MPPSSPEPVSTVPGADRGPAALSTGAAPTGLAGRVAAFRAGLVDETAELSTLDDRDRLDLLRELELLTRTVGAVGARVQVGFHASQVATQLDAGVPPSRAGRAVPDDLAQARMTSPYWGSRDLTCAKALCAELPQTLGALMNGIITSYQARLVAEATTTLEPADRAEVDARLAVRLPGASTKEIEAATRALVYEVDPAGFVKRARKAAADRRLSLRPRPDVMALLSARLPAPQAIAVYRSLRAAAEAKQAAGDPRTLDQLAVDELYERVTGRTIVDGIDVEVGLVITDLALFAGASTSAELIGYGPIPAELARELLRHPDEEDTGETDPGRAETGRTGTEAPSTGEAGASAANTDAPDPDGAEAPDLDDPALAMTSEEIVARARADAAANANGFVGGRPPEGHCPDGGRCTNFSCSLIHGAPAPPTPSAQAEETGSDDGDAEAAPDTPRTDAAVRAAKVWLRRLLTDPVTGALTARDPRRRLFTGALRAFLIARDRTCRNNWCGAPIRHIDHITRHRDDGTTDEGNGRGLCARCNLARERTRYRSPSRSDYRGTPPLLDTFVPRRE